MFDNLPPWARPAARVAGAFALIGIGLLILTFVVLLAFPQVATFHGGYPITVIGLAGGVAVFCAVFIVFFILWEGMRRGDWD